MLFQILGILVILYMFHIRHIEVCFISHIATWYVSFLGVCVACTGTCTSFMMYVGACGDAGVSEGNRLCHIFFLLHVILF